MTADTDVFVEEARLVTIGEAVERLGLSHLKGAGIGERVGSCPACGGTDRFSVNASKGVWNCRNCGGGRDAIGLAGLVAAVDVRTRDGLLAACSELLGRPVPGATANSAETRADRERRLRERQIVAERERQIAERNQADYRERERDRARGKWRSGRSAGVHRDYLARRIGVAIGRLPALRYLRTIATATYWHGQDERGNPLMVHEGPAMVAPFVDPAGLIIGCHLTWIDLRSGRNARPSLFASNGEALPTKKMRGTKKGGLIPLIGFVDQGDRIVSDVGRNRFVSGEGIENVVAIAIAEGPRSDTIYAAAGDLGNLAGPADPSSRFPHPELRKRDARGRERPVAVQGPVPKTPQGIEDAMQAPAHVSEILLVGDGDSEPYATMSAMARGQRRLAAAGAEVSIVSPPDGLDFAELLSSQTVRVP